MPTDRLNKVIENFTDSSGDIDPIKGYFSLCRSLYKTVLTLAVAAIFIGIPLLITGWSIDFIRQFSPFYGEHFNGKAWSYQHKHRSSLTILVLLLFGAVPLAIGLGVFLYANLIWFNCAANYEWINDMARQYGYGLPWGPILAVYISMVLWRMAERSNDFTLIVAIARQHPDRVVPATEADAKLLGFMSLDEHTAYASWVARPEATREPCKAWSEWLETDVEDNVYKRFNKWSQSKLWHLNQAKTAIWSAVA